MLDWRKLFLGGFLLQEVRFGTDGIRDIVNKGLTASVAFDAGCALALSLKETVSKPQVVIGHDTRKSADMLINAFSSGLMSYGVDVVDLGLVSTPAVSYITEKSNADAGVMITASHNTSEYNGIKIFNQNGGKVGMQSEGVLEKYAKSLNKYELCDSEEVGVKSEDFKALNGYLSFLRKKLKKNELKVAFDCANGVTNIIVPKVFKKINTTILGDSTVSCMVNKGNGVMDIKKLQTTVVSEGLDVGFAFDGDGDRIYAVDEKGKVLDGDDILGVIALYALSKRKLKNNTVVGTVMTNCGIEGSLKLYGIKLIRQNVGDRFIQGEMRKNGYVLGGEQSGHIIIGDKLNTGDGVLTAITILNIMRETRKRLSELTEPLRRFPSELINVAVREESKNYILTSVDLQDFIRDLEQELGCKGRILVRASGTESKIRILVEGEDKKLIKSIAETLKFKILSM